MKKTIEVNIQDKMNEDVSMYLDLEKELTETFLKGVTRLGTYLKKMKELYKPKGMWVNYLENIDKSLSHANRLIQLSELSVSNNKELANVNIDNWAKAIDYLRMSSEGKKELESKVKGKELNTREFKETISEIEDTLHNFEDDVKDKDLSEDSYDIEDGEVSHSEVDILVSEYKNDNSGIGTPENYILEKLIEINPDFTEKSIKGVEVYRNLFLILESLDKNLNLFKSMNAKEKEYWDKEITKILNSIQFKIDTLLQ